MAFASSHVAVEDSLSCAVCIEKYDSSDHLPKILPCQHTFCSSCVDSLRREVDDEAYECPLCRREVLSSAALPTNLAVRDIVDAMTSKQHDTLSCANHPNKLCYMICTDCWQPLCTVCVKELRKGIHRDHDIDDLEDVKVCMKDKLVTKYEENIAKLDEASAANIDQLMQESETHAQHVNAVVAMITKAISAWREDQLTGREQRSHQAIEKQAELCESLKAPWKEKMNCERVIDMVDACKEADNPDGAVTSDTGTSTNIRFQQEDVDQLQDKLSSVCDTIRALVSNGILVTASTQAMQPTFTTSSSQTDGHSEEQTSCNSSASQQPDFIAPPTKTKALCPECHRAIDITACIERKANLYNLERNNTFHRVVHDRRRGNDKLICMTDDFMFILYNKGTRIEVCGLWTSDVNELLTLQRKWSDISNCHDYKGEIKRAMESWQTGLQGLRYNKDILTY